MTEPPVEHTLPRRILLATDLSSRSDRAFDRAVLLAREWDAQLHVVHALETPPPSISLGVNPEAYGRSHPDRLPRVEKALRRLVAQVDAHIHVEQAPAAQAILAVAEREACDLIILGEIRQRLAGPLEGTLDEVVRKAPASVLAVRTRPARPYGRLIVGTDLTDEALQALNSAHRLFPKAAIRVVHAFAMPYASLLSGSDAERDWASKKRDGLRAHVAQAIVPGNHKAPMQLHVVAGSPAAVLRDAATQGDADLSVIGAHPRGMLYDAAVGNSRLIIDAVPSDILVVRAIRNGAA